MTGTVVLANNSDTKSFPIVRGTCCTNYTGYVDEDDAHLMVEIIMLLKLAITMVLCAGPHGGQLESAGVGEERVVVTGAVVLPVTCHDFAGVVMAVMMMLVVRTNAFLIM